MLPYSEIKKLIGISVTPELLIGRNYYHYTNGCMDNVDLSGYPLAVLKLEDEVLSGNDLDEDLFDDGEENCSWGESLADYIPGTCWVKRFATTEEECCSEAYLLLIIELNDKMEIINASILVQHVRTPGMGMFILPDCGIRGISEYMEPFFAAKRIIAEAEFLKKKLYLPKGYSFIGKRLPQEIINAGGNGGSDQEYTYALQSAYRLAYMHMSVDTTEEGIIKRFYYTTYQSTGSGWGDLFSRPHSINDMKVEAIDMLLYLVNHYTEGEYADGGFL
jgi:hypothetical protein